MKEKITFNDMKTYLVNRKRWKKNYSYVKFKNKIKLKKINKINLTDVKTKKKQNKKKQKKKELIHVYH